MCYICETFPMTPGQRAFCTNSRMLEDEDDNRIRNRIDALWRCKRHATRARWAELFTPPIWLLYSTQYSLLTRSVHSVVPLATKEEKLEMLQICWLGDYEIYHDNGRYRAGWIVGEIWRGHPMCEDDPEDYSDDIGENWL